MRVNAIGPGPTDTPMLAPSLTQPYREMTASLTPLGQAGTPAQIADAVSCVLHAERITGQVIMADGGAALMSAGGQAAVHAARDSQNRRRRKTREYAGKTKEHHGQPA
jgi:enoyl-[acyl-carrier-protein] reductase (NADH)